MTAYNRLNGAYCAEHAELLSGDPARRVGLRGVRRHRLVRRGSTVGSPRRRARPRDAGARAASTGPRSADAVRAGEVDEPRVDAAVEHGCSRVFDRIGALDDPPERREQSVDRARAPRPRPRGGRPRRWCCCENDGAAAARPRSAIAIARGHRPERRPGADHGRRLGAARAALPRHAARRAPRRGSATTSTSRYERGLRHRPDRPAARVATLAAPDGEPGFAVELRRTELGGRPVRTGTPPRRPLLFFGEPAARRRRSTDVLVPGHRAVHARRDRRPHASRSSQLGRARVLARRRGRARRRHRPAAARRASSSGWAAPRSRPTVELDAGEPVELVVEYVERATGGFCAACRSGCRRPAARRPARPRGRRRRGADAAVVVVGTNDDWESEGHDRDDHGPPRRPGRADRAASWRPTRARWWCVNTGVAGRRSTGPTTPRRCSQAWFGGQEMANALADVLTGDAEPGGRLPTTFPVRLEHNPSFGNFPGENGEVRYGEGVLVGYRWYDARRLPDAVPVRARAVVHDVRDRRARRVGVDRRPAAVTSAVGAASPTPATGAAPRSCSATWRRRRVAAGAPAEGAEGVRQGVARPGRGDDGDAHARPARVPRSWDPVAHSSARRPRPLRAARRSLVEGDRPSASRSTSAPAKAAAAARHIGAGIGSPRPSGASSPGAARAVALLGQQSARGASALLPLRPERVVEPGLDDGRVHVARRDRPPRCASPPPPR